MQLSPASVSSPKRGSNRSGQRLRKRHKRLDAICEEEYNRNHGESNEDIDGRAGPGSSSPSLELRRSSRVRRPPDLLDVSPPPAKKRRKKGRNSGSDVGKKGKNSLRSVQENRKGEGLMSTAVWNTRLRSRRRNVRFEVKSAEGQRSYLTRRRKLFGEMDETLESGVGLEDGVEEEGLLVSNKKIMGKDEEIKALKGKEKSSGEEETMHEREEETLDERDEETMQETEEETMHETEEETTHESEEETMHETEEEVESESDAMEDDKNDEEIKEVQNETEDVTAILENVNDGEPEDQTVDNNAKEVLEEGERGTSSSKQLEDDCNINEDVLMETVDHSRKEGEQLNGGDRVVNGLDNDNQQKEGEDLGNSTNEENDGACGNQHDGSSLRTEEKPLEGEKDVEVGELKHSSREECSRSRIKQGRRCGLCGCGNDGKPPKRLIQDGLESEKEAYSGSSASEEPNYDIWDGFGDESSWLGRLLGPINDRYGIAGIWVHQHCAVWSPEVRSFYLYLSFMYSSLFCIIVELDIYSWLF